MNRKQTTVQLFTGPIQLTLFVMALLFVSACSSSKPYTLKPVKTFDPDTTAIPEPDELEQLQYWDRIDNTIFHQIEKVLDLNNVGRFFGRLLGVADPLEAHNINVLDEVPESSWYTYRHYHQPMSIDELRKGPNTVPPDTTGKWTIFSAKLDGANPGFFIKDQRGNRYLIKFDGYKYPELTTGAEVIGTKIFYAAGYTVPEAVITYIDPDQIEIGKGVMTENPDGSKRQMNRDDLNTIFDVRPVNENGKVRALASKFVNGIPKGPWNFEGTRDDDPNDRVDHEHRRELRGMRILSSWLNDTDRRDANTMAVYTPDGYIAHYVQDFGNTLGANGGNIHKPIYGQAYLIDLRYIMLQTAALGLYVNSWETVEADVPLKSVGYFKAERLKPEGWVSAHPMPPFENMTMRDAFWGTKLVSSFSDKDIRAIVETADYSDQRAVDYLTKTLIERRDMLEEYWFTRINPLDKFRVELPDKETLRISFSDLGIESGVYSADETEYEFRYSTVKGKKSISGKVVSTDQIFRLQSPGLSEFFEKGPKVLKLSIKTKRAEKKFNNEPVDVYITIEEYSARIAGINREE